MLENAKENLRENAKAKLKIYPIKWTQQEEGFLENGHYEEGMPPPKWTD